MLNSSVFPKQTRPFATPKPPIITMHYVRHTPSGLFSYWVIQVRNVLRIFGVLITEKSRVLFYHQRKNQEFRSYFVIQKRGSALGTR
ncbi:hypothetical protein [Candidatus Nitrosotenuis chungbukensis]|uniref:hypothetical protein n=1 Tax=Candidatus Nitrosotenuis chungbukensis TaxID=1353246 RepID=UPI0005B29AF5|nr:hypothetical protein [Candidatus Nitrosotenuis chungbukensis]